MTMLLETRGPPDPKQTSDDLNSALRITPRQQSRPPCFSLYGPPQSRRDALSFICIQQHHDHHLVAALKEEGCPKVWVVTSDHAQQDAAHGAVTKFCAVVGACGEEFLNQPTPTSQAEYSQHKCWEMLQLNANHVDLDQGFKEGDGNNAPRAQCLLNGTPTNLSMDLTE
ncbi:hypothetical protein Cgig2_001162 [Carnegiea gigantea]|uniref:Uncharacterized protein n=1 Tax=Carnegiea gigantea TaxID=171969 RepID=A0A9Q1JK33_9CARY|nr:hypothetical protein Cgig2_001162 [Carnegiea gigantea]